MAQSDTIHLPPTPPPRIALTGTEQTSLPGVPPSGRAGLLAALLIGTFALLLASFSTGNSDVWKHLAAGRSLTGGESSLDADPRLTPDLRVSRTWLYDLFSFGLYTAVEHGLHPSLAGPGLVLFKALLVAGTALLLLRLSRAGREWWVPAACTALAVLAMGTRLLLQPATVSYLFLALTLWFLRPRGGRGGVTPPLLAASRPPPLPPPWQLLALFVVWVNVDQWFVLGLATAALVWLGQALDFARQEERGFFGLLVSLSARLLVPLSLLAAVCLLNPYHVHAFALPPELARPSWSSAGLPFAERVTTPFGMAYFEGLGWSPAALAYFPLLGLGLLSFVLNLPRWHWRRLLPWAALAALSVFESRTIPFFAVVAGPVLAWNLQEALGRRFDWRRRQWRDALTVGHGLAVAAGLALLVCAWPGRLQPPPFGARRWAVETAPSLERGAAAVRAWRREGRLGPESRGLHLSREAAQAFAWFCPEEKGLLDDGLAAAVRGARGAPADWRERMRAASVNHVIVYDPNRDRRFAALARLLGDPGQWPLLYLEGDLAIFGWRDPDRVGEADLFRGWQLDLNRLAFHPAEDKKAPAGRPEAGDGTRYWWEDFWKPAPPPPTDRDEATLHLFHAEALLPSAPFRHMAVWGGSQSAGLVAAAAGWSGLGGPFDAHLRCVLLEPRLPEQGSGADSLPALDKDSLRLRRRFILERDDTPPALLYLAVRAARRAVAANPNDAQAHLVLGQSYLRLLDSTGERVWGGKRLEKWRRLRRAQACAALNRAVSLRPDFAMAHFNLVALYQEMGCLDLALSHYRTYLGLLREEGPGPGVAPEQFQAQVAGLQEGLNGLAQLVRQQRADFADKSKGLRVADRAQLAADNGLAGEARDLLLRSDVAAFGRDGLVLELDLLLGTGRPREVWRWTRPEHKDALGGPSYHWLRAQALAALGEYALADEELAELARSLQWGDPGQALAGLRAATVLRVGQAVLGAQPAGRFAPHLLTWAHGEAEFRGRVARLVDGMRQGADVAVFRGLLALERGDADRAEAAFREALSLWEAEVVGDGWDFNGRVAAQTCLKWLEDNN